MKEELKEKEISLGKPEAIFAGRQGFFWTVLVTEVGGPLIVRIQSWNVFIATRNFNKIAMENA